MADHEHILMARKEGKMTKSRSTLKSLKANLLENDNSRFRGKLMQSVKHKDEVANLVENGQAVQRMILSNDEEEIDKAFYILHDNKRKYRSNMFKMWIYTIVGVILGSIIAPFTLGIYGLIGFAYYDRSGLDSLTQYYIGDVKWDEVLVNDLFIATYSYNSKKPRFYDKYFIRQDPGTYNGMIHEAVAASASAPGAFNPKTMKSAFNITEELIDGGVICNSPAYYAYETASSLRDVGTDQFRVLSIGTGISQASVDSIGKDRSYNDPSSTLTLMFDFILNIDNAIANEVLRKDLGTNFARL